MRQVEQRKMKSGKPNRFIMRKLEIKDFLRSLQTAGQKAITRPQLGWKSNCN